MGSSFYCELRLTSLNQDVWRGRCCSCLRQWLRHVQGRLRRRRRPQGRLPLHRWTSPPARNHHQLGRHGEDLAPHLLQRAPRCPRGAARPPDWGSPQPQGQQGEDDPDHVRDLQHARHVRRHPGYALPVRLRPYHRYRHGLRRRSLPRCPRLRGLRSPPLPRGRLSVTSRRSSATLPWTSSRRCPPLPPPPPWRSPTSCPTARSSPSATRGSGAPRPSSSPASWEWRPAASTRPPTTPS